MDGHETHVRMPNIPGIAVRIETFQLTQIGFSIALHVYVPVHVQNLNLSNIKCLMEELGMSATTGNPTYNLTAMSKEEILQNHQSIAVCYHFSLRIQV